MVVFYKFTSAKVQEYPPTKLELGMVPNAHMTHAVRAPKKPVVDCGYLGLEGCNSIWFSHYCHFMLEIYTVFSYFVSVKEEGKEENQGPCVTEQNW